MSIDPHRFIINRIFSAPREKVWQAWTDPALFGQWFGPRGFTSKVRTMELRPGGILHSCLVSPDGQEMWAKFVYRDVDKPSHLSWEHSFSDKDGNITRHPFQPNWPLKLLTTVLFEESGDQTKLTLSWEPLDAAVEERKTFEENMGSMTQGWTGTFDQLEAFLAK